MPLEPDAPLPTFDDLPLSADVRRAVDELGYVHPTPVQRAVFEPASRGRDLVVAGDVGDEVVGHRWLLGDRAVVVQAQVGGVAQLLGEVPRAHHAIGFALILAGVWLASVKPAPASA